MKHYYSEKFSNKLYKQPARKFVHVLYMPRGGEKSAGI